MSSRTGAAACLLAAMPAMAVELPEGSPSLVEHDADVAVRQGGPHEGLGESTGYVFFDSAEDLRFSFRKRVLHPGATIGPHPHNKDEVYYIISGKGLMTIDGVDFEVGPGDAMLTRVGSSHALVQQGDEDLVLIVVFEKIQK